MNDKKLIGRWGEALAADYLRKKRYKILGMGYSTRFGEVDVIAEKDGVVAFVEVKTRKDATHGEAREFVTKSKQRRVIAAASMWCAQYGEDRQPRFDVIEIYAPEGELTKKPEINHIENAFWTEGIR
ncbi:MAG: YraN family protein [Oscillospiraceae bacterium]|nr:YraN family protein [Oscillospiraceae bacterium]